MSVARPRPGIYDSVQRSSAMRASGPAAADALAALCPAGALVACSWASSPYLPVARVVGRIALRPSRTARVRPPPSSGSATTPACCPIPRFTRPRSTTSSMPWARAGCRPLVLAAGLRARRPALHPVSRRSLRTGVLPFPLFGAAGRCGPRCSSSSSCPVSACSTTTSPRLGPATGPNWLGDSDVALWSIIGLTVWKKRGPTTCSSNIAGLQNVPRDTVRGGDDRWRQCLGSACASSSCPAAGRHHHRPS